MKKTILSLALVGALFAFAENAKAQQSIITNESTFTGNSWLGFDGTNIVAHINNLTNNGWSISANPGGVLGFGAGLTTTLWNTGSPLDYNASIDSTGSYEAFWNHYIFSTFTDKYFGIKYDLGAGDYDYGWVELSFDADSNRCTLMAAAINTTPNQAINAGVISTVPEPSTYVLFGISALLLAVAARRNSS